MAAQSNSCNIASIGEPVPSIKTPPYSSPARSPREPQRGADVVRWRRRSFLRSESLAQRGARERRSLCGLKRRARDSITGRARQLADWGIGGQEEGKGTFAEALAWTLNTWQPALAPEAVRTGFARWGRQPGSGVRGFASSREAAHQHRHDAVDGVADGTLHKATMADFDTLVRGPWAQQRAISLPQRVPAPPSLSLPEPCHPV